MVKAVGHRGQHGANGGAPAERGSRIAAKGRGDGGSWRTAGSPRSVHLPWFLYHMVLPDLPLLFYGTGGSSGEAACPPLLQRATGQPAMTLLQPQCVFYLHTDALPSAWLF